MSVRRALRATLFALTGFLLAAGLAGLAAATDEPEATHLALPAPRPGDEALYTSRQVRFDSFWGPVPYVLGDVQMGWTTGTAADDLGQPHDVLVLRLRADYQWSEPQYESSVYQDVLYDAGTQAVVQVASHENVPEAVRQSITGVSINGEGVSLAPEATRDSWTRATELRDVLGPCGFFGPVHAGGVPLAGNVSLGGSCDNDAPTGDTFRYDGTEEIAGVTAYRFQNVADPEVRVWYAPGLAFPVKVRDHFTDLLRPEITNGWVFEWTLHGVRAGAPAEPVQGEGVVPPLAVVATTEGAPDAAGLATPFPLEQALAAVRADEPAFTTYLDTPQAYLGFGWLEAREDGAGRLTWTWHLLATDGDSWRSVAVERAAADPRLAALDALQPPPLTVRPWDLDLPESVRGYYPRVDQVAPTLPRVADAYTAFDAASFRTSDDAAERYAFLHQCWGDCDRPVDAVVVGVLRLGDDFGLGPWGDLPGVPDGVDAPAAAPPPKQFQALRFRDDGRLDMHVERTENLTAEPLLPLPEVTPARTAATAPAPAVEGAWRAPSTLALAALAGVSLAGGLAWWLWPGIKGLAGGLFSRIEGDKLLDHPGRARIRLAIEADPGVHFSELARRTGHAAGALRHHLGKMESAGLVVAKPLGGYTCYFVPGTSRDAGALANASARSDGARKVLDALQSGHVGVRAIAAATGLAPSTVSHHLARLRQGQGEGGVKA